MLVPKSGTDLVPKTGTEIEVIFNFSVILFQISYTSGLGRLAKILAHQHVPG